VIGLAFFSACRQPDPRHSVSSEATAARRAAESLVTQVVSAVAPTAAVQSTGAYRTCSSELRGDYGDRVVAQIDVVPEVGDPLSVAAAALADVAELVWKSSDLAPDNPLGAGGFEKMRWRAINAPGVSIQVTLRPDLGVMRVSADSECFPWEASRPRLGS